ncbi:Large-conductance mechanosensitive channel MscMJLR [Candidatus Burarchaeum australiense]|nr:Large-conductance mechanosensitive channel MscMJLR [Candidatus Burarchaeum australiense]
MLHEWITSLVPYDSVTASILEGIVYFIVLALGLRIIAELLLRIGTRITGKTANTLDDHLIMAVKSVMTPLILFISFVLMSVNFFPNAVVMDYPLHELLVYIGIALGAWALNRLSGSVIGWYDEELQSSTKGKKKELFSFVKKTVGLIIYAVAAMIMLDRMGIQIAPLLAGLGVAGLAVALALQGTLSNLFAGMHILADKPFRVGQFIMIDNDPEKGGVVEEIGWRSTRIRLPNNNVLIVPNARLAESEITNTTQPSSPMVVSLKLSASYDDPVEKVEKALTEAVREAIKNEGVFDKNFSPVVRANAFLDSGIEYAVIVQVNDYMAQYPARGAIVKEVEKAFRKYKITIPYPTRLVHLEK